MDTRLSLSDASSYSHVECITTLLLAGRGSAVTLTPVAVFVNIVVASLHAHCFSSARGVRSGLSQTSSFNSQSRVVRDQRCGLRILAFA